MRVLILGADGTFGHVAMAALSAAHEVHGTCRGGVGAGVVAACAPRARRLERVDAGDVDGLRVLLAAVRPEVVLNAIGVVKQRPEGSEPAYLDAVNARFPHRLAEMAEDVGAKVVHLSSDCVFSGTRGRYTPDDAPDPVDAYDKSKLAGEIARAPHLTLRTSFVGRQLRGAYGLVEWFLAHTRGSVSGFVHAVFSGLTTAALADVIAEVLERCSHLSGLHHVAAAPISKYELLSRLCETLRLPIDVVPDARVRCDRSLDGSRFEAATGIVVPSWTAMIERLAADVPRYEEWRGRA